MPQKCVKRRKLRLVRLLVKGYLLTKCMGQHHLADLCLQAGIKIANKRYLIGRIPYGPRKNEYFSPDGLFYTMSDSHFKERHRCTREAFARIVTEINSTEYFQRLGCRAANTERKLSVALFRFSNHGNGVRIKLLSQIYGKSMGTIVNWTRDVVIALVELEAKWLKWPNRKRCKAITKAIEETAGVEGFGVVGFLDGVHIRIYEPPAWQHEIYFNRKKFYSFNVQLVVDHEKRIIGYGIGCPGSITDSKAWKETPYHYNSSAWFSRNEFLLTDSGYAKSNIVQPKIEWNDLVRADLTEGFTDGQIEVLLDRMNSFLSQTRVISEHANGILKSRWQSLRGLRNQMRTPVERQHAIQWIIACMVLHNMLTDFKDTLLKSWVDWDKRADVVPNAVNLDTDDIATANTAYASNLRNHFVRTVFQIILAKKKMEGT